MHKWIKRFDERNLYSLEEESRRPQKVRGWMVTKEEEANVVNLRKRNIEIRKKKLQVKHNYQTETIRYL